MRYTRIVLLTFGAGFALGLLVDVFEAGRLARVASGLMALGLLGLPLGIAADLWPMAKTTSRVAKKPAKTRTRRNAAATPRSRKTAVQNR
jgi:hypothetical protein